MERFAHLFDLHLFHFVPTPSFGLGWVHIGRGTKKEFFRFCLEKDTEHGPQQQKIQN